MPLKLYETVFVKKVLLEKMNSGRNELKKTKKLCTEEMN